MSPDSRAPSLSGCHGMPPEPLDAARLRAGLPGWVIHCLNRTGSTNDEARRLAAEGTPHLTAVLAEEQTAGRGRRGSRWISPPGRNAVFSAVLRPGPALPPELWPRLTLAAALAGCDALDALPHLAAAAEVKWPNDLYLSGRKVAGILVEGTPGGDDGPVTVGMGINLNLAPGDFPPELRETATSVWIERGGLPVDRTEFVIHCLRALALRCTQAASLPAAGQGGFAGLREEAWRRNWLAGKQVSLTSHGRMLEGTVCGLGPEGELLLQCSGTGTVRSITSADEVRPLPPHSRIF